MNIICSTLKVYTGYLSNQMTNNKNWPRKSVLKKIVGWHNLMNDIPHRLPDKRKDFQRSEKLPWMLLNMASSFFAILTVHSGAVYAVNVIVCIWLLQCRSIREQIKVKREIDLSISITSDLIIPTDELMDGGSNASVNVLNPTYKPHCPRRLNFNGRCIPKTLVILRRTKRRLEAGAELLKYFPNTSCRWWQSQQRVELSAGLAYAEIKKLILSSPSGNRCVIP